MAHLALAAASRAHVDEILCVVPRAFPHKEYFGATLEQRIEMLGLLDMTMPGSIATTEIDPASAFGCAQLRRKPFISGRPLGLDCATGCNS